jgi:hypothetical protein
VSSNSVINSVVNVTDGLMYDGPEHAVHDMPEHLHLHIRILHYMYIIEVSASTILRTAN